MSNAPSHDRGFKVAWAIAVPLGAIVGYIIIAIIASAVIADPITVTLIVDMTVILIVLLARRWKPLWTTYDAPTTRCPSERALIVPTALCALLAFLGGETATIWIYSLVGSNGYDAHQQATVDANIILVLALNLVVGPMGEEVLFRGAIYPMLRRHVGIVVSVAITAVGFALVHGNLTQIVSAVPLAVLLALLYERTRRLWPCMLLHGLFNLAATFTPASMLGMIANPVMVVSLLGLFVVSLGWFWARSAPVGTLEGTVARS